MKDDRIVHGIVWKYWRRAMTVVSWQDLTQEAWLGILEARRKYDSTKGEWPTFAFYYVYRNVRQYWQRNRSIVSCYRAREKDLKTKESRKRLQLAQSVWLIKESDVYIDPFNSLVNQLDGQEIFNSCRDVRRKDMLYRLINGETLQEIGDEYGLTRERVRQITTRELNYLRNVYE